VTNLIKWINLLGKTKPLIIKAILSQLPFLPKKEKKTNIVVENSTKVTPEKEEEVKDNKRKLNDVLDTIETEVTDESLKKQKVELTQ
jgi:hypothetical protein